ncbi:glycosyltransferase family 4 protein, partial [Flavobacteriaceae bacterium]|nr:glycosyltransferase family 4 protein [Flavobacteriaceae bacterium]
LDKTSENKKLLATKASRIIAISESTRQDLIEIFNINPSKIEVIYLANSLQLDKNAENKIKLPKKYILYVGSRGGYKNFMNFLSSVTKILNSENNLHLVCAGGGKFDDQENTYISKNNLENKLLQFNIDDKTLSYFYSNAKAFIFPSLYEGFGIPVLEAFACGCPLICSNTSSLPEIASDAAVYFDPSDEKSIHIAVLDVLKDHELRTSMIKKGYKRLEYFSWEKTAQKTKNLYKRIDQ